MGDDFNQLLDRLPIWANWLFSTPWWVPSILATALTAFLLWLSWPRKPPLSEQGVGQGITDARPAPAQGDTDGPCVSASLRKVAGMDEWVMDVQAKKDLPSLVVRLDVQEYVSHLDRFDKWRCKTTFAKDRVIEGETFYIHLIKWDWPGRDIKWAFWCYEGHDSPDQQTAEAGRLMLSDEFSRCRLVFRSASGESQIVKFIVLSRHRNDPAECPILISEEAFNYEAY